MPQNILAGVLTPPQSSKLPIWFGALKVPQTILASVETPPLTGNAPLNLETISGGLPLDPHAENKKTLKHELLHCPFYPSNIASKIPFFRSDASSGSHAT